MIRLALLCLLAIAANHCDAMPAPAELDSATETCRFCRMPVSDQRTAAQIVASGDEPLFFDDVGCLREFLRAHPLPAGGIAFVADHASRQWVASTTAVYASVPGLDTPMGSHIVAYANEESRTRDLGATSHENLSATALFGGGNGRSGSSASIR
jgi:copper chaperone NosL